MKKVHILKSAVGISLAVVFAFQGLGFGSGIKVFAENKDIYSDYFNKSSSAENASVNVPVNVKSFLTTSVNAYDGDGFIRVKENGAVEFSVNIPAGGLYGISLKYRAVDEYERKIKAGLLIDEKTPFDGAQKLVLPVFYENSVKEHRFDSRGNQITPEQVSVKEFKEWSLIDDTGVNTEPYVFYFSRGGHKIRFENFSCDIEISGLTLYAPKEAPKYAEIEQQADDGGKAAETVIIEAEDASFKTSHSILPKSDSGSVNVNPNSAEKQLLNNIGGTDWSQPTETLYWDFNIESAGWYSIGFNYKQSDLVNGVSKRSLMIDGEYPFEEAKNISFGYSIGWKHYDWSDGENLYYIFLDAGKHTLSMSVTLAETANEYYSLNKVVNSIGDEYVKILMLTGESPDLNRSYDLFKNIPDFQETLKANREALKELVKSMQETTGKRANQYIAAMQDMIRVLKQMYDMPYLAHQYVTDYYSSYTTLSSWLYEMKSMPLSLDRIYLVPKGEKRENTGAGFFKSLSFGVKRFLNSFVSDYSSVSDGDGKSGESLTIWLNWGMDQATALNNIIQDSFTAETGTPVKLKIVTTSLLNGLLSGNFPDLILNQSRNTPLDLGIRGALYELNEFEDFDDVITRFMPDAVTPYEYNGKCYALPETQIFQIMFYRSDILESLGLSVPATWDEFIKAATVIQRNNMQIYVPYTAYVSGTAIGGMGILPTLMLQKNVPIYNETLTEAMISENAAVEVFDYWTKLYTDYKYMKEADFYNRFRTGSIPLGIAPYSPTYMQILTMAPELSGRWSVALVPGFDKENRTAAGSGTACAIVKKSPNIDKAWEFLKWWTDADTQVRYINNIESVLGSIGRVATANVEALKRLNWQTEHLGIIMKQWENVKEIPEVPGSYYLARAIDQSYWEVVNGQSTAKDALKKWNKTANQEIERKISQYIK